LAISHRLKDALLLRAANDSVAIFSARLDRLGKKVALLCFDLLAMTVAPSDSKESNTQEGTMDSRLRGNDSSHRE
jgi:hypothetical protein